ncbi:MAG: response regulator [Candidatus Hinthialibacter antarcticus]|nr:response regulator [Candidatus Hinthialibacter antarcticus]
MNVTSTVIANLDAQVHSLVGGTMPKTVLIVEDHQDSRELLADALEFSGYAVLQASDGEEGERIAIENAPDVILLDISLPKKSGWDVVEALRLCDATKETPIIALTAHARAQDESKAMQVGCNHYLPKPVKPKQVLQTIQALLGEDA